MNRKRTDRHRKNVHSGRPVAPHIGGKCPVHGNDKPFKVVGGVERCICGRELETTARFNWWSWASRTVVQ